MRVLGIVPARGGSKGVPRKNLQLVGGKSLIQRAAESASQANLSRLIVSTDDLEIAEEARRYGLEVPFIRPSNLATDTSLSIDLVIHALEQLGNNWDAVCLLQPTSPFRRTVDIKVSIEMLTNSTADSVISLREVGGDHPGRMRSLKDGYLVNPEFVEDIEGQPRQSLENFFLKNGAVYVTRVSVIQKGNFQGKRSLGYVMPHLNSINIDSEFDLLVAEALAQRLSM